MNDEMLQRVRELFDSAEELPASERMAWLQKQTGNDTDLYDSAAKLLRASLDKGEFLSEPAWEIAAPTISNGAVIGSYRVLRELGSGGMGIVYLVVRADHVFHRLAAIKVIRPELGSDPLVNRFLTEREILARLDHPNIARIIDGGQTKEGLPYFVMDYVDGLPINIFCARRNATLTQRLNLFRQTCNAVQYLHENGIVHCDLKPANLLVTQDGVVKLLDFGIARPIEGASGGKTGLPLLTPNYASPEQILSRASSSSSDIYSLGAILYELLTGFPPLELDGISLPEMLKAVAERVPPPSSRRPSHASVETDVQLAAIHPRLRGDLDSILLMALRKEPSRRYASPAALAADIESFQKNLPVAARRDSVVYVLGKTVRRYGMRIVAAMFLAVSLSGGGIATYKAIYYRHQIEKVRNEVETIRNRYLGNYNAPIVATKPFPGRTTEPEFNSQQFSKDMDRLAYDVQSTAPAVVQSPIVPRSLTSNLVEQSLDLLSKSVPQAINDPASAAALGRAYLAVSRVQWNPDGASLDQPAQAAESCRQALQTLESANALAGNKLKGSEEVKQVAAQLLSALQRIPRSN